MKRRLKWPTLAAVALSVPPLVDVIIQGLDLPRVAEVLARGSVLLLALAFKPSVLFSKPPPPTQSPD
jgi:hypothetical protein